MFQAFIGLVVALSSILLTAAGLLLSTTIISPAITLGMVIGGLAGTALGAMIMSQA